MVALVGFDAMSRLGLAATEAFQPDQLHTPLALAIHRCALTFSRRVDSYLLDCLSLLPRQPHWLVRHRVNLVVVSIRVSDHPA